MQKKNKKQNAFILYNYNRFNNDFEYIQEYYNINDLIKDNNIQLNNKRSIYHYIKKEIGDNIGHLLKDKYIIINEKIEI